MSKYTFEQYIARHEATLQKLVETLTIPAESIKQALQYSLCSGGKRFRPLLVYLCGEMLEVELIHLDVIAAAIEVIHCYSLIHDDLPAMDNDDYRRGKLSCHRAFNEATAILVGDGMQAFAIEILLSHLKLPAPQIIRIALELLQASGMSGMVSGQALDLHELSQTNLTESRLAEIHHLKTGQLIKACIQMVVATCDTDKISSLHKESLQQFSYHLGLVFQMQDDYLDHYDQTNRLGKNRSSDIENQKTTYASFYSELDLQQLIQHHFNLIKQSLNPFGSSAHSLFLLIQQLFQRSLLISTSTL